jgi:hypothetical protein
MGWIASLTAVAGFLALFISVHRKRLPDTGLAPREQAASET